MRMRRLQRTRLLRDLRGSVSIEYALLAAVTAIIAIGALFALSQASEGLWTQIGERAGEALTAH